MQKKKIIDVQALVFAALFTIGADFGIATWYGIQAGDIMRLGAFGLPMFFGMCALVAGVPAYVAVQFFRRWRHFQSNTAAGR